MSLVHLFCCCYRVAGVEVVVSRDDVLVVFFKDTATTEIYTSGHTLSPHDALPICRKRPDLWLHTKNRHLSSGEIDALVDRCDVVLAPYQRFVGRSEEHTSELQSLLRISSAVFCSNKKMSVVEVSTTARTRNPIHSPMERSNKQPAYHHLMIT